MEAAVAFGVASGVMAFVDFAWKLVVTGKQAYNNTHGATVQNLELERVHRRMKSILESLATLKVPERADQDENSLANIDAENFKDWVASCREDCEALLTMLDELKTKHEGRRQWKNVAKAFKALASKSKLEAIHERLEQTRDSIQWSLSIIVSKQVFAIKEEVAGLAKQNQRLGLRSEKHLDQLTQGLDSLVIDADDSAGLYSQIQHCQRRLPEIQSAEGTLSLQQDFIASLYYDARPIRHEEIPIAYQNTFTWAYESGPFKEWLLKGDGIFWVSGKPGSGKSTLMRFLADNPSTVKHLKEWAQPAVLMTAAHYFWFSGSQLQKSYLGLLRSLLFEILTVARNAIPSICPQRWTLMKQRRDNPTVGQPGPWTVSDLTSAMYAISKHVSLGTKICLFVDGLDEYDGDHVDLCNTLRMLTESQNIKACVSSRPWNVFHDAFGKDKDRLLFVHDLTRNDIAAYARGQLQTHPKWNTPTLGETRRDYLVEQVCERAEGVFLWVYLVTKSLRAGFTNEDQIDDLQRRIELLPTDLEKLFQHIVNHLDPIYHHKSGEAIELAIHARGKLSPQVYGYHEMDHDDEDYVLARRMERSFAVQDPEKFRIWSLRRINALTGGLLEVRGGRAYTTEEDVVVEEARLGREYVDFLHRTVGDFFSTTEGSRYLARKTRPGFDVYLALTKAAIASVKITGGYHWTPDGPASGTYSSPPVDTIKAILEYASLVQNQHSKTVLGLLDELERSLMDHATGWGLQGGEVVQMFRNHVFQFNLKDYASRLLQQPTTDIDTCLASSLRDPFPTKDLAYDRDGTGLWADDPLHGGPFHDMLDILLQAGASPNQIEAEDEGFQSDDSIWVEFLKRAINDLELREEFSETVDFSKNSFYRALNDGTFKLLLNSGADPNASYTHRGACETAFSAYLGLAFSPNILINGFQRHHADLNSLDQAKYIDTLCSFLDAGADFSRCFSYRGIPTGVEQNSLREYVLESIPVWELDFPDLESPESIGWALCNNLRWQHHSRSGRVVMPNGTLLFQVLKTILGRQELDDAFRTQLIEAISFTFPVHIANQLLKSPSI